MTVDSAWTNGPSPSTAPKTARIIDFDFRIFASDGPVTFGDTKEGMFGIRVASSMDVTRKQGGRITNAEGLTDEKAWGKPSPWVDYVGPVKDKIVGIAIINHPLSFRYPTTWHVRTYGLFAANPFGWHDFGRPERGDYTIPGGSGDRVFLPRGPARRRYQVGKRGCTCRRVTPSHRSSRSAKTDSSAETQCLTAQAPIPPHPPPPRTPRTSRSGVEMPSTGAS